MKLVRDEDLQSQVVEVSGEVADVWIACPSHPKKTLGIKLPFIVLIVKNVGLLITMHWAVLLTST